MMITNIILFENHKTLKTEKLYDVSTLKLVNLMIKSSDKGKFGMILPLKENILSAIELAKLCKKFADEGHIEEAMNIDSIQWIEVIDELKDKLKNI